MPSSNLRLNIGPLCGLLWLSSLLPSLCPDSIVCPTSPSTRRLKFTNCEQWDFCDNLYIETGLARAMTHRLCLNITSQIYHHFPIHHAALNLQIKYQIRSLKHAPTFFFCRISAKSYLSFGQCSVTMTIPEAKTQPSTILAGIPSLALFLG
jgi:hypothetical protein